LPRPRTPSLRPSRRSGTPPARARDGERVSDMSLSSTSHCLAEPRTIWTANAAKGRPRACSPARASTAPFSDAISRQFDIFCRGARSSRDKAVGLSVPLASCSLSTPFDKMNAGAGAGAGAPVAPPAKANALKYVCGGAYHRHRAWCCVSTGSNHRRFPGCGTLNTLSPRDQVRCRACGYRIFYKVRTERRECADARQTRSRLVLAHLTACALSPPRSDPVRGEMTTCLPMPWGRHTAIRPTVRRLRTPFPLEAR
jgi:DNA-directed RNA polymerase subunit RPC12/RpoP